MSLFHLRRRVRDEARASHRRRQRRGFGQESRHILETLEPRLAPAVSIWNGSAGDGLWSTGTNWDQAPQGGDELRFPAGALSPSNTNDLAPGLAFSAIEIDAPGYVIGGAAITLTGPLTVAAGGAGTDTVNLPINFSGTGTVSVAPVGATLVLGGLLTGTDGLAKQGAGELDLTADNTYTGTTTVSAGVLRVDGAQATSPVSLASGTTLRGRGTVGAIGSVGGIVSPDLGPLGIMTASGDLTLDAASTYTVAINGITPGTEYTQLGVTGQVTLGGATLSATRGFTPAANEQFVIVNNTGTAAVSGTFANLPEGSELTLGGETFQISYKGGTGNDVVLTHLFSTTTAVGAVPTSAVFGQHVVLTATVTSSGAGTPTGNVQFFSGATLLGNATLNGNSAMLDTTTLPLGSDHVTATYQGDDSFASSTSPDTIVDVGQASTTTTFTNGPNPSVFGQPVALTATVSSVAPGSGTPTGTVQFFAGATSLGTATLSTGTATLTTAAIPVGNTNAITAQYLGDTNFAGSTSSANNQVVNQASTTGAVSIAPNPSSFGQSVLLTATITATAPGAGTPTGTVEFFAGSTSLGTATLSGGVGTLSTSSLPLGTSAITAHYQGSTNFLQSTSPAQNATVNQGTTTTVNANPTSVAYGQTVTIKATVAPTAGNGTPTGNVTFMAGTTTIGNATLQGGVATLVSNSANPLPAGTNQITATYAGDSTFGGSTSTAVPVTVAQAATTSTVTASPNPASLNQLVTLTATVASTSPSTVRPSGNIQFFNGATLLGTAVLNSSGIAAFSTAALLLGNNSVTAVYAGDNNYTGSTTPALNVLVKQGSATALAVDVTSPVFSQPVKLTATVTPTGSATGTPTGQVEFFSNSTTSLGKVNLVNGVATLNVTTLPIGSALITARYLGDDTFNISNSPSTTVTVGRANSSTTVSVAPNPSAFSQIVTLTARVTPVGPATAIPGGTVQFFNGTTLLGSGVLNSSGVATLNTTALALGTNSITAQYVQSTQFNASTSAAVTATVRESNSRVTLTVSKDNPVAFEAVKLTATVAADTAGTGTPTGTVVFMSGGKVLGSSTLSGGVATLVTTNLKLGTATVSAIYKGDDNFNPSASNTLTVHVGTQDEQYLNQVYASALGRTAQLWELDLWRTQLRIGVPRSRVVTKIVNSPEGQIAAVRAVYQQYLRRQPTDREIVAGVKTIRATSGFAFEASLLGSKEYFFSQGNLTNSGFLTALYRDVLGTDVPADQRVQLTRALNRGVSRTAIARGLVESQPGKTALVNFFFKQILGRPATTGESSLYVRQLNAGSSIRQVFINILSSNTVFASFRKTT